MIADQRELELEIRRGEMVSRHQMREWVGEAFLAARDVLLKLAPELKDRLAAESDPMKIEMIVQDEVETSLRQITDLLRKLADNMRTTA